MAESIAVVPVLHSLAEDDSRCNQAMQTLKARRTLVCRWMWMPGCALSTRRARARWITRPSAASWARAHEPASGNKALSASCV